MGLATVGIYGLRSFRVSQKQHELGIRMALGAQKRDVLALFLKEAGSLVGRGLVSGVFLAWVSTRAIEAVLYGVRAGHPVVYLSPSSMREDSVFEM